MCEGGRCATSGHVCPRFCVCESCEVSQPAHPGSPEGVSSSSSRPTDPRVHERVRQAASGSPREAGTLCGTRARLQVVWGCTGAGPRASDLPGWG